MNAFERPWLASYDEWLEPDFEIPDMTYPDLMRESFRNYSDRPAYYFMGATQTYEFLEKETNRFARYLFDAGCKPGDVVGICLPNIPQYLIAHAGTLKAGCIATGVSPLLSPKEMTHQLVDSGANFLVTLDMIFEQKFLKIHQDLPDLIHVSTTNVGDYLPLAKKLLGKLFRKVPSGRVTQVHAKEVSDFKQSLPNYSTESVIPSIDPDDICVLQYTGGTTGLSKGTMLSHRNIVSNMLQTSKWANMKLGREIYCSGFPFFHLAGLGLAMSAMSMGNAIILIPDPRNTDLICSEIEQRKPTIYANVPSLYQLLMENPKFHKLDFSACRMCLSAAAPLSMESFKELDGILGSGKLMEAYGMTETSPIVTINPSQKPKPGSVGVPVQNTYVKIVDLETHSTFLPPEEEGEIIVYGPQVMVGYHNNLEETDNTIRPIQGQKWLFTGDIGKMDEDGYLYILDRAKDMLNVGGFKVFSREAEETLYKHPAIEFCAIVGVPNPKRPGSELVKAVIQLIEEDKAKNHEDLKKDILAYCQENMAPYKVPKIIEFVDPMPLTNVGKVDKKALRN